MSWCCDRLRKMTGGYTRIWEGDLGQEARSRVLKTESGTANVLVRDRDGKFSCHNVFVPVIETVV